MKFADLFDNFVDTNNLHRTEGTQGIRNLAKMARGLGYCDPFSNGQFAGGCFGDLHVFLEDNPGAVAAIFEWVRAQRHAPEWEEELAEYADEDEDEDDEE